MQRFMYVVSISLSYNHGKRPCQLCLLVNARVRAYALVSSKMNDRGLRSGDERYAYSISINQIYVSFVHVHNQPNEA